MKTFLTTAALCLGLAVSAFGQATIFVTKQGSDLNTGADWAHAKATMQAAMDASNPGDQIWVAKGTYTDSVTLEDSRKLLGSFAGNETDPSQRNMTANPTVLVQSDDLSMYIPPDCGTATTVDGFVFDSVGTAASPLENSDIECWGSPTFSNCLLTGAQYSYYAPLRIIEGNPSFKSCTISGNDLLTLPHYDYEPYLVEVWSSASFSQCKFASNLSRCFYIRGPSSFTLCSMTNNTSSLISAEGLGSVLLLSCVATSNWQVVQSTNASVTVKHTTFQNTSVVSLASATGDMELENCQFSNTATNKTQAVNCGGYLFMTDCQVINQGSIGVVARGSVQRCVFSGNGGGFINPPVPPSSSRRYFVTDSLFVGNGAGLDVGGYDTIANCTFVGNGASGSLTIHGSDPPDANNKPIIANNIVLGNGVGVGVAFTYPVILDHNDVLGNGGSDYINCSPGPTDIHVDPKLFNPANGDCHLAPGSPAIGTGNVAYVGGTDTDLDGISRLTNRLVSIGAYEPFPISLTGMTVSSPVVGGFSTPATISLSAPAYYGLVLAFTESNVSGAVSLPYPAGSKSASLEIPTQPVTKDTTITLTVIYGNTSKTASLLIKAPGLQSVQLPSGVVGGNGGTGTLHFSGSVTASSSISLSSSSTALTVPATVAGSGGTTQSFTFITTGVAVAQTVTVTATFNGIQAHGTISVLPANLSVMLVSSKTVKGGGRVAGYAYLDGLAPPAGAVITLTSDNPAITVPSSITIKGATNASYLIQSTSVTKTTVVHVTGTYRGVQVSVAVEVDP
jgi:hypothetical protein